jgi:hypothetical protein
VLHRVKTTHVVTQQLAPTALYARNALGALRTGTAAKRNDHVVILE